MSAEARRIRLVHFVGEGIFSSVLDSQVLVPLRLLGERAPHVDRSILCLTSIRFRGKAAVGPREDEIREAIPAVPVHFKYRPILGVPFQDRIWARGLAHSLAEWGFGGDDPIVVHCRGHVAAAAAVIVKRRDPRIRVLLDMRGDPMDEAGSGGLAGRYHRRITETMLTRALAGADGLNTVTRRLADVLAESGFLGDREPDVVIGCCVDTKRFSFDPATRIRRRKELGLEGKFVVCYCGAMSHWQRPDAIARTFAAVLHEMPDAHMLAVSHEADPLMEHLSRVGVDAGHITTRSVPHDQVASYLVAADLGLLLREDTPTNHVASPVKFAEYLRCGLPVILTSYIDDFADLVAQERVGRAITFPIRNEEAVEAARRIRAWLETEGDGLRRRCSRVAFDRFSWEGNLHRLVTLYEKLSA